MRTPAAVPAPGPRVLPGALSPLTADLVRGARRPAVVLAVGRFGAYLGAHGRVLPVLSQDAVALPGALRLTEPSATLDLGLAVGDVVVVGGGCVRTPGATVRGVRTWRPARVRAGSACSTSLPGARPLLAAAVGDLDPWLAAGVDGCLRAVDPYAAVAGLVGRGEGLTPAGDDALAGALLLRRALDLAPPARADDALVAAVRARLHATTAVSASLLDAAAGGWAAREVVALLDAVVHGGASAVRAALPAVLAIGHTSGRDLVTGLLAALDALVPSGRIAA
ncbi:DUF2877 domain-containing protein [Phycicoccus duodecadis]|uniref:Uncharacterized protein DUF2877 n=1 Tax=Phycicoccus duodecadis TaxID=173053 RepID=A0A2N3YKL9_9MICO|nr:DUF2877 domain-containing protein [Phycicoccus duodecadis]PKW27328.1 uncharacterized protein DUF2877 [Phycicoccus duodecadis]